MTDRIKLNVGDRDRDRVRLTGTDWPEYARGTIVTVDRFKYEQPWSDAVIDSYSVGSVGIAGGFSYTHGYDVEIVVSAESTITPTPLSVVTEQLEGLKALGFTGKQARRLIMATIPKELSK